MDYCELIQDGVRLVCSPVSANANDEKYQWNKRQPVPTNQVQPPVKRSNAHCNAIARRTVAWDEKSDFTRYVRDFHKCGDVVLRHACATRSS